MKLFECQQCANPIFFENTTCENCGCELGYLVDGQVLSALKKNGSVFIPLAHPDSSYRYCANHQYGVCNWLVSADSAKSLCVACELNETIPDLSDPKNQTAWRKIEVAKHRLIYSLIRFGLAFENKVSAPETGLAFDFLADASPDQGQPGVLTGHTNGRITINIAEAEPDHREAVRLEMAEPYRTLIGHFRHEIGHYYWQWLIREQTQRHQTFRALFGDERLDYSKALDAYYQSGPPSGWQKQYLSAYSASHPWEAWAETWAHYFHLIDTLETAQAFGVSLAPPLGNHPELCMQADFDPYQTADFDAIISAGIPLTLAVNSINRSMGLADLYPFVIPSAVVDKLRFIHQLIRNDI